MALVVTNQEIDCVKTWIYWYFQQYGFDLDGCDYIYTSDGIYDIKLVLKRDMYSVLEKVLDDLSAYGIKVDSILKDDTLIDMTGMVDAYNIKLELDQEVFNKLYILSKMEYNI